MAQTCLPTARIVQRLDLQHCPDRGPDLLFSQLRDGIIYSSRTRPQIIYSLSSREAACSALLVRATWWDLGSYR